MFTARVTRKTYIDLGKAASSLRGPSRVKVGFPAGKAAGSAIEKAVWNEFGTAGGASGGGWGGPIPERPFLRNAMRDNSSKYRGAMQASAIKILRGSTGLRMVLAELGISAQGDIQAEIASLSSPPNSPVTIEMKGSSKPLIDTGKMSGAVTYQVTE